MATRRRVKKLKQHLHLHAWRQSIKRYGLVLSIDDLDDMARLIIRSAPGVKRLFKQSLNRAHYQVPYKGVLFHVVYDKKRAGVVTILPPPGGTQDGPL